MKGAQKLLAPLARSTSRWSDSVCGNTHGNLWCVRHQNRVIPAVHDLLLAPQQPTSNTSRACNSCGAAAWRTSSRLASV
jgi:hypothetical protein